MGLRLSFGVGPLRASVPLTSRRRRRKASSMPSLLVLFLLIFYVLVLEVWLLWALIALSVAGIARLRHNDDLVQRMIRSLKWKMPWSG
jgi:hypothetical protein